SSHGGYRLNDRLAHKQHRVKEQPELSGFEEIKYLMGWDILLNTIFLFGSLARKKKHSTYQELTQSSPIQITAMAQEREN
ncbi:hypothetical protein ACJX0J_040000, partial [Zea mays]